VGLVQRVYHGIWNSAPFQSLYEPAAPLWQALPQMPEWYLVSATLAGLSALGLNWRPLLWATPLLVLSVLIPLAQIVAAVCRGDFSRPGLRALTAGLFVIQPMARLWGRFAHGLTPWRQRGSAKRFALRSFRHTAWSESWRAAPDWIEGLRSSLRSQGALAAAGGDCDRWDLQIRGGLFGAARIRLAVEEHGAGKQLLRWRAWPRQSLGFLIIAAVLAALALGAAADHAWTAASVLAGCVILMVLRVVLEGGRALGCARSALEHLK